MYGNPLYWWVNKVLPTVLVFEKKTETTQVSPSLPCSPTFELIKMTGKIRAVYRKYSISSSEKFTDYAKNNGWVFNGWKALLEISSYFPSTRTARNFEIIFIVNKTRTPKLRKNKYIEVLRMKNLLRHFIWLIGPLYTKIDRDCSVSRKKSTCSK